MKKEVGTSADRNKNEPPEPTPTKHGDQDLSADEKARYKELVEKLRKEKQAKEKAREEAKRAKGEEKKEKERVLAEKKKVLEEVVNEVKKEAINDASLAELDKFTAEATRNLARDEDIGNNLKEHRQSTLEQIKDVALDDDPQLILEAEIFLHELDSIEELSEKRTAQATTDKPEGEKNSPFKPAIPPELAQQFQNGEISEEEFVKKAMQNLTVSPEMLGQQFDLPPDKSEFENPKEYEQALDEFVMKQIAVIEGVGLNEQSLGMISKEYRTLVHVQMNAQLPGRIRDMVGAYFKYFNAKRVFGSVGQPKEFSAVAAVMERDMFANLLKMKDGEGFHRYSEAMFKAMDLLEQNGMELLGPRVTGDQIARIHKKIGDEIEHDLPENDKKFAATLEKMAYNYWRFTLREAANDKFWVVCDDDITIAKTDKRTVTFWRDIKEPGPNGKYRWEKETIKAGQGGEIPKFSYVCSDKEIEQTVEKRMRNPKWADEMNGEKKWVVGVDGNGVKDGFGNNSDSMVWLRESMDIAGYLTMKAGGMNGIYCPELINLVAGWKPDAILNLPSKKGQEEGKTFADVIREWNIDGPHGFAAFPKFKAFFDFSDTVSLSKEASGLFQNLRFTDPKQEVLWYNALYGLGDGQQKFKELLDVLIKLHEYNGIIPMSRTVERKYDTHEKRRVVRDGVEKEEKVYATRKHKIFSRADEILGSTGEYWNRDDIKSIISKAGVAGRISSDGFDNLKRKHLHFIDEIYSFGGDFFGGILNFIFGTLKAIFVDSIGVTPSPKRR